MSTRAMRIAVVNQPLDGILPPGQNSIGIWTYETARRLADRCELTVYGKYLREVRERSIGRSSQDQGVAYRFLFAAPSRVWERVSSLVRRWRPAERPIYISRLYYFEYALQVAWKLRRTRPDIVHVHNFTGFVPTIRRLNPGTKIVLHMSCEWLTQLDHDVMDRRIGLVDAVFGTSHHITELVKQRFPHHADRCHTVYNGVDPSLFARPAPSPEVDGAGPRVLFVGRVSPEKGVHDLVEAMSIVFETHDQARLDVVGGIGSLPIEYLIGVSNDDEVVALSRFYSSEYLETLRGSITPGREGQVVFHGGVSHDAVIEHLRRTDMLVNPSYSESFGITPVEAMACGVPVIATAIGGMTETVLDGVTGYLVDRGRPDQLADRITELADDPSGRVEMGNAGRQRVIDLFSWDSVADRVLDEYRLLLGNPESDSLQPATTDPA